MKMDTLLWIAGGAALLYFLSKQTGVLSAITTTATPYSIYPEYAYTATTSMAKTPTQQASTVIQPTTLYSNVQQQAASAIQAQCVGSYPACTPMLGDTQLGM